MSSYEEYPEAEEFDESSAGMMYAHAEWFDAYAREYAEIETVADYRACRPSLKRKAQRLFEQQWLSNEPVTITTISDTTASLVDYSTNQRHPAGDAVAGYLDSYYVVARPVDIGGFLGGVESLEDLEQYAIAVGSSGWRDDTNPMQIELGIRLRPLIMPLGCDSQHTYIEIPIKQVGEVYEMEENHPLVLEANMFARQSELLLQQKTDVPESKEQQAAALTALTDVMSEASPLKEYRMELSFHDGVSYVAPEQMGALRDYLDGDEDPDVYLEVRTAMGSGPATEVFVKGFDWQWEEMSDDEFDPVPLLYVNLEFTDEDDVMKFGYPVISMPVDGIRFGICYPVGLHTQDSRAGRNALKYEQSVFSESVEYLESIADEDVRLEAIGNFLQFIHEEKGSRALGSQVAIRLDHDRVVQGIYVDEEYVHPTNVVVPEWYECVGIVESFLLRDTGDSDDVVELGIIAVLDVSKDRYFSQTGIQHIEIPLDAVEKAVFVAERDASKKVQIANIGRIPFLASSFLQ